MKRPSSNAGQFLPAILLVAAGIAGRLLPHPANFTPIAAIALFGGLYLPKKMAAALPLTAMLLSDLIIGFYSWPVMLSVYLSFAAVILIGHILRQRKKIPALAVGILAGSMLFFLTTNWAVWAFGTMYEKNFSGLMQCYYMALPFFRNSLLGDLFFAALLVGAMEAARFAANKYAIKNGQP